ncbi:MAG: class I SAM-dependent methyltransferase [Thermoanaerobaculia bacterium]|nr:class I SAM-dependent methyltransferase [Thermoanaerobaculia bacterium]
MTDVVDRERHRLLAENARRRRELPQDLYAPWAPAEQFMRHGRQRLAARLLQRAGVFPDATYRCLEIGFGGGGWLPELLAWGASERNLHGVEIDASRLETTRQRLPAAHLLAADAADLPYSAEHFELVIASTVFTSILDDAVRRRVASEIERVLRPGGALLWYDFAVDNPRNPNVRGVSRRELLALFPKLRGTVSKVTLAAPLCRLVSPRSWWLAELLEALPPLRTHLLGVLLQCHPIDP